MKRIFTAFLLLAVLTNFSVFEIAKAQQTKNFSELETTIQSELKDENIPGAAVAIVSGDKIVFAKGFGVANVETNQPVTPETLFQTGSITKTFTAAAILGLAEEGKLKLDAPIGNYAKGLSPKLSALTLHHLLSHTSGIIDEPDEFGEHDESRMAVYLRSWTDDYSLLEQGEAFSYSNSGFALAGFTAQEAANKKYTDLMTERVFAPLGMTRTTFQPMIAMTYPLAVGHLGRPNETPRVVRPLPNDARLYPAGTMYSSANELAQFITAFLNNGKLAGKQILSPAVIAQMSTERAKQLSAADGTGYGYGLFMNMRRGVRALWHDGSMTGYTGSMLMVPEQKLGIIILSNGNGAQLDKTQEKALELMLKLAPKPAPAVDEAMAMNEAEMKKYAGVYEQPKRFKIEVYVKDAKLFIKEFDLEMPLVKVGENRFAFKFPGAKDSQYIFIKTGKDGKPVFLHQYVWAFKYRG